MPSEGPISMIEAIGIKIPDQELKQLQNDYLSKHNNPVEACRAMLKDGVYTEGLDAQGRGAPGGGLCATATCFIEALGRSLTLAVADKIFDLGQGKISMTEAIELADKYLHDPKSNKKFLPSPTNHEEKYQPSRSEKVVPRRYEDGTLFAKVIRDRNGNPQIVPKGSVDYNPTIPPGITIQPDFQVGFIKTGILRQDNTKDNITLHVARIGVNIENDKEIEDLVNLYLASKNN
ncbi:MAG: hypothetical protein NZM26_02070 [Patescibacteria group bacterium]|nr:hypothetical protein [Patescibacteria group bacterium]